MRRYCWQCIHFGPGKRTCERAAETLRDKGMPVWSAELRVDEHRPADFCEHYELDESQAVIDELLEYADYDREKFSTIFQDLVHNRI